MTNLNDSEFAHGTSTEVYGLGMQVVLALASNDADAEDFEKARLAIARLIKYAHECDDLEAEHAVKALMIQNGCDADRDPMEPTDAERAHRAKRRGYAAGDEIAVENVKRGTKIQFEDGHRMRVDWTGLDRGVVELGQDRVPGLRFGRDFARRKKGTMVTVLEDHADLEKREGEKVELPADACTKCGGEGKIEMYAHINGGTCFSCGGSGKSHK